MNDLPDDDRWGPHGKPPRDVVRGRGLDREMLLDLNANAKRDVFLETPGDLVENVDGDPLAAGPRKLERIAMAPTIVTRALLEELGVDPSEVPKLIVRES